MGAHHTPTFRHLHPGQERACERGQRFAARAACIERIRCGKRPFSCDCGVGIDLRIVRIDARERRLDQLAVVGKTEPGASAKEVESDSGDVLAGERVLELT